MPCSQKLVVLMLLLPMIATSRAHADDGSSEAFRAFGLEGIWSPDCRQPPSKDNPRVVWRDPIDGPVLHAVTFDGITWALVDTVSGATILDDNVIRFTSVRNGKIFATATVERIGDRIHPTTSVGALGEIYVRDGIELRTGKPTPTDERCDIPVPIS